MVEEREGVRSRRLCGVRAGGEAREGEGLAHLGEGEGESAGEGEGEPREGEGVAHDGRQLEEVVELSR